MQHNCVTGVCSDALVDDGKWKLGPWKIAASNDLDTSSGFQASHDHSSRLA
jgi:hypothetical protein